MNGKQLITNGKLTALYYGTLCRALFFLMLLAGCDRRDITYYLESELMIEADWSLSQLPDEEQGYGATTLFYNAANGTLFKPLPMGSRENEDVRLPQGCYHAVIFNRSMNSFSNIIFSGSETYETLKACARQVETRTDPETRVTTRVIVSTPEELAGDVAEFRDVTEAMLGNYNMPESGNTRAAEDKNPESYIVRLTPQKLTQRVRVRATVPGINNIRSAMGLLNGVSEGVFLSTRLLTTGTVTQQFDMPDIKYDEGSPFNGILTGEFNVFGFDRTTPRKLVLKTLLVDGKTIVEQTFNVTSRDIVEEDGTLTIYIEIVSEKLPDVKPEGNPDSGFDTDVDEWGDPIEEEIPLK